MRSNRSYEKHVNKSQRRWLGQLISDACRAVPTLAVFWIGDMSQIEFTVEGIARPQGSKRHVGNGIMVESSKHVASWRTMIRDAARKAMQAANMECQREKAVTIQATFYFERPKAHYTSKGLRATAPVIVTKKPDVDKLLRAVLDACSMVVYYDDCQVQIYQCNKLFTESVPRAEIKFAFLKP